MTQKAPMTAAEAAALFPDIDAMSTAELAAAGDHGERMSAGGMGGERHAARLDAVWTIYDARRAAADESPAVEAEGVIRHLTRRTTRREKAAVAASLVLAAVLVAIQVAARGAVIESGAPTWLKALLLGP